jgi:hypothetical protein
MLYLNVLPNIDGARRYAPLVPVASEMAIIPESVACKLTASLSDRSALFTGIFCKHLDNRQSCVSSACIDTSCSSLQPLFVKRGEIVRYRITPALEHIS